MVKLDFKIRTGPGGVHLFWRKTGLNVLYDELRVPATSWSNAPRFVSVALTNACDLGCPYCYAPKGRASLSFERLTAWLTELDVNGCLGVGFGGGEPTLYPHLVETCVYTARKTGLAVTLTTHAHRFDESLVESLAGHVHFIRVSMDGVDITYENLRQRPFNALMRCLKVISRVAPFGINFVVNSFTFADLNRAIEIADEMGAKEFLLLPEQPVHGTGGITASTMALLHKWVWEYKGSVPLAISEASAVGMPACHGVSRERGLRAYAHIDASSTLKRSSYDASGIGISSGGVMEALSRLGAQEEEGGL